MINIVISIGLAVFVLVLAWVGFTYIVSATNPEARSQANRTLTGAVIGMVLILSAWLIIDFVMRTLYSGPDGTEGKFGPWNSILAEDADWCIVASKEQKSLFGNITLGPPVTVPTTEPQNPNPPPPSGTIQARICSAANAYKGNSTLACNCGGNACAWAVNNVLQNAGLSRIGDKTVKGMESGLRGGRGQLINRSGAVCGDVVLVTASGRNHVGVCLNNGCTSVISNSSTNRSFSWISNTNPPFSESYSSSAERRYYRVTK